MAMVAILHVTAHQIAKILLDFASKIFNLFSQNVNIAVPMVDDRDDSSVGRS